MKTFPTPPEPPREGPARHPPAAAAAAFALLLAGCAGYGPPRLAPGTPPEAAVAALGPPTAEHPRPEGGMRLEFARGPFGRHTWMLDYDAQRRLLEVQQVLTEANFDRLRRGLTEAEVRYAIGSPSERRWLPRQQHQLWNYRYEGPFCRWFQVSLDPGGQVADLGYGPDPLCDHNEPDLP